MDQPKYPLNPTDRELQHDVQQALSLLDGPIEPIYYRNGIIDAGAGYYQLAKSKAGDRVLLFALHLEDLQRRLPPGGKNRPLLARPEKLFVVAAYVDEQATSQDIDCDMVKHQAELKRDIREEYTIARSADGHYRSRTISYGRFTDPADPGHFHVHGFIDALHGADYAEVYAPDSPRRYNRIRHPQVKLTTAAVSGPETVKLILENFAGNLEDLAAGRDNIQHEDCFMSPHERRKLRLKVYAARFVNNLRSAFDKNLETYRKMLSEGPADWFEIVDRVIAARIFFAPSEWIKHGWEFTKSVLDLFNISEIVHRDVKGLPEAMQRYVEPPKYNSKLSRNLRKLKLDQGFDLVPLTEDESGLCTDRRDMLDLDPFKCEREPDSQLNMHRVALGTIVHLYGAANTMLLIQANGLWIAVKEQPQRGRRIYIGYNKDHDTQREPHPTPQTCAQLRTGKVLRLTIHKHHQDHALIDHKAALKALPEITAAGDAHLLDIDLPPHRHVPHIEQRCPLPPHRTITATAPATAPAPATAAIPAVPRPPAAKL